MQYIISIELFDKQVHYEHAKSDPETFALAHSAGLHPGGSGSVCPSAGDEVVPHPRRAGQRRHQRCSADHQPLCRLSHRCDGFSGQPAALPARLALPGRGALRHPHCRSHCRFFSATDLLAFIIPTGGVTLDNVLITLYGGLLYGFGLGLVYLGQGTSGGSDILGRILNSRFGVSISQAYLITDGLVVLAGGFAFGWVKALYGLLVIYICGQAATMISEGSSIYRTAMIVTSQPTAVAEEILKCLCRGTTILTGTGAYTGESRPVLYVVITRSEVNQLKELVRDIDPKALMVIGVAHEALGEGFRPLIKR